MNGERNNLYTPFGFSAFVELLSHHYGPLIGMDRDETKIKSEICEIMAQQVADYKKAEKEADKIALELAIEEEMEKVKDKLQKGKQEQKKERKKRQRLRRKLKNQLPEDIVENEVCIKKDEDDIAVEEELDTNSAFVSNAAVKISNMQIPKNDASLIDTKKGIKVKNKCENSVAAAEEHPVSVLAIQGFNFAKEGCLQEAISKFSEALLLAPEDYRLYANRCLCYLQIQEYHKALADAERCVKYASDYSIGYFRMGESYLGLNNFQSAEEAFEQVLKLDPNCQEASNDLFFIQTKKLMDMGFSKKKATMAMHKMKTLNAAIEYLLHSSNDSDDDSNTSMVNKSKDSGGSELFQSDDDEEEEEEEEEDCSERGSHDDCSEVESVSPSVLVSDHKDPVGFRENPFMDHNNPYHCKRLYVGNVSAKITNKFLESAFARFGTVLCIKILPTSKCAFVTYQDWRSAGKAMENLQQWSLMAGTPPITIKYPTTDLQKLAGNSLSRVSDKSKVRTDSSFESASVCGERDDWCSRTMPPPSPAPSLSSVRSSFSQAVLQLQAPQRKKNVDTLKNSNSPNKCGSLFIGNLIKNVKESDLISVFSRYGPVISVRFIADKHCAFVNYTNSNSAALAMSSLQGKSVFPGLPPLVIKYPTKAVKTVESRNADGQVLGDECYNWRTLGCSLGKRCPNKHVPEHKGIALRHKAVFI